ncbi:MAG TPA: hypothetical protein VMG10_12690 [Gemmataceae bacterium]|nr:hypothetical protein [Gemmataceae bacterium]
MNSFITLPAGIRLDPWPEETPSPILEDPPEIAQLREEMHKSMPEVATMLDTLNELRPIQDLAARFAGPEAVQTILQKG